MNDDRHGAREGVDHLATARELVERSSDWALVPSTARHTAREVVTVLEQAAESNRSIHGRLERLERMVRELADEAEADLEIRRSASHPRDGGGE